MRRLETVSITVKQEFSHKDNFFSFFNIEYDDDFTILIFFYTNLVNSRLITPLTNTVPSTSNH